MGCLQSRCICFFVALVALVGATSDSRGQSISELETSFAEPPSSARPNAFWYWLNGNITRDGITRDLEAMQRVGLGGVMVFDGGVFIPKGPVDYMSPAWLDRMTHAVEEADRLGLEVAMHNAPGWSSSGGPWITPELSMQQLVWTEVTVSGPQRLEIQLPQPYTKEDYYRDALVVAFPSPPGEEKPYHQRLKSLTTADGTAVDPQTLTDGDLNTSVRLGRQDYLVFEFAKPFEARSITVYAAAGGRSSDTTLEVSDDGTTYRRVTDVSLSPPRGIEFPGTENFSPVRGQYFRLTPERPGGLAEIVLHRAPQIEDWNYKGHFAFRLPRPTVRPSETGNEFAIDPATVRDLSAQMGDQGRLVWNVPDGSWTILRFGHTPAGHQNVAAPDAGRGLECDKFSRQAIEFHFQNVVGKVIDRVGPLAGKTFVAASIDSYEVQMQNWTAEFPKVFQQRNGYDLRPYMPAMTGRIVGSADVSDRFLFDVRRTQANLMADNYYGGLADVCHEHGLKLYVEPYGPGPFDELQVGGRVDIPMTEFWARFPWGDNRVVKSVSSSAHIYGKPVVAAEAFTAEQQTGRWLEHPYALKPVGDLMFSLGFNKAFFHRYAHQPHPDVAPGMTMGPWGFHFDRTNTWFDESAAWLDYLTRCQYMLQQGTFVADVLYFVGERTPEAAQYTRPRMPPGHTYDLVNAEVLLSRVKVEDGRIVLPEGTSYRLLVIPDDVKGMTPELLRKLRELVSQGMTILGPEPEFSLTLRGYPTADAEFAHVAEQLWGDGEANRPDGHAYEKGHVFSGQSLPEVLRRMDVSPDFEFSTRKPDGSLVWLHRRLADADVYFVANRQRRTEDAVCTFRVADRQPEFWNPETGELRKAAIYESVEGRTGVPMRFEPAQSVLVVFRDAAQRHPPHALLKDGAKIIDTQPFPAPTEPPGANVQNTFTISVWVKPDSDLREMPRESATGRTNERGKNYVIPAPDGDTIYGTGHAAVGLAAGRNGIYVVERSTQSSPPVLVANVALAGWTHMAVIYDNGRPKLYVNGKFVREGVASGSIVHPGVGVRPDPGVSGVVYYFEGDQTEPMVFDQALAEDQIRDLYVKGLPPPDDPPPAEVSLTTDGRAEALIWESGEYALGLSKPVEAEVADPIIVSGPWRVSFPPGRGAPESITLDKLTSLHRHPEPGVRYFSGTATYTRTLDISAAAFGEGRRVCLDLGRVEVIAEVEINGQDVGVLWKPPYRLDVTDAVRQGPNELVIRVTNLWPNRLIGDEQLPAEYEYARNGGIAELPDWYVRGEPEPAGGRTSFATWKFFDDQEPLLESGLIGPVRVFNPVRRTLPR